MCSRFLCGGFSGLEDQDMIYTRRSSTTVLSATPEVKLARKLLRVDQLQLNP